MFDGLCAIHRFFREYSTDQQYIKIRRAILDEKNVVYQDELFNNNVKQHSKCFKCLINTRKPCSDSNYQFNTEDKDYHIIRENGSLTEKDDTDSDYSFV